jgi:site-specific DNA-methyltransferase (adenine-specific)
MIYQTEKPPLTHRRYEQKFEYMFIFSKGSPRAFSPIMEKSKYAGTSRRSKTMRQDGDHLSNRSGKGVTKPLKIKGNVWLIDSGFNKSTKDASAFSHPAIFPEQLAHDHIISWSNEGDTVFDPFLGSGTTGKMARQLNRNFIGIEKVEKYFDIAKERIPH